MSLKELLNSRKIKKIEKHEPDFSLSDRDLKSCKSLFRKGDFDWAFNIAYNAVLQAGRTLMFVKGYRTSGINQHKTVFEFLRITDLDKNKVDYFDGIRQKRNMVTYRNAFVISKKEAEECIKEAGSFVQEIRTFVQEIRTGGKK